MPTVEKLAEMPEGKFRIWASGLIVLGWAMIAFIVVCMFIGIPKFGALAWGADVKNEVKTQLEPVTKEVSELKKSVEAQTAVSKIMLERVAADKLMTLMKRRCKTIDADEKAYLTEEIRKYKIDYYKVTDTPYEEPGCDELGYFTNVSG